MGFRSPVLSSAEQFTGRLRVLASTFVLGLSFVSACSNASRLNRMT